MLHNAYHMQSIRHQRVGRIRKGYQHESKHKWNGRTVTCSRKGRNRTSYAFGGTM